MSIQLRVVDKTGNQTAVLGDVESLTLSPVLCDAGTIEFSYPVGGANWASIKDRDEFGVQVYIDGARVEELDGLIKEVDGDDVEEASVWKFTGFFNNGRLAEAVTYPQGWPSLVNPEQPNLRFTSQSAGAIIRTLMQQAQARGTLTDIDFSSFTSLVDSAGANWDKTLSVEYAPQVDYLEIFQNLHAEQGMVDFQMKGNKLYAYRAGTMNVDRTTQATPLVFRRGRDLLDSPRKRSTRDVATALLAAGQDGLYREVKDDAAIAGRRRIEAVAKQGQIQDEGTLLAYGQANLSRLIQAKMEKTHGLVFADPDSPRPIKNFHVGDWAYSDTGNGLERLRTKQWVLKLDKSGELTGSVTLNDFFAEQGELLNKRIQGIIGGSTVVGASRAVDRVPADLTDKVKPSTPQGLGVTSEAYATGDQVMAQATATWLQVTTNEDGTIIEDLERYAIQWRQPNHGSGWEYVAGTSSPTMSWSGLISRDEVEVQVRAEDRSGNVSPWSGSFFAATGSDTIAPPVPSRPVGDNYLGLMRFQWDGKFKDNAPKPSDFSHIKIYAGKTNFNDAVVEGTLNAAGSIFLDAPYGENRFVWFTSVDTQGNESDLSIGTGPVTNQKLLSDDIFAGAVGSAALADAAVINAKIANLAVNDAKIQNLSVAKLVSGLMTAEVAIGGRFATALTGMRTEFNSLGFFRFDANGVATVAIDANGALITGQYRTATSGRRIVMGVSGAFGELRMYSPDETYSFFRSYTPGDGREGLQLGSTITGAPGLWNSIFYNQQEWASYHTKRHDFVYQDQFNIIQTANRGAAFGKFRLTIDQGLITLRAGADVADNSRQWAYDLVNGNLDHTFSNGGRVRYQGALVGSQSPWITLQAADNYGVILRTTNISQGTGQLYFDVRNVLDTGYAAMRASLFEVNSDARGKEDISEVQIVDPLGQNAKIKPKKYRRKGGGDRPVFVDGKPLGVERKDGPEEIGVVIDRDFPEFLLGDDTKDKSASLVKWLLLHSAAIQALYEMLLKKGVTP